MLRKDENGNIIEYNDRFDYIEDKEMFVFDFASPPNRDNGDFDYRIQYEAFPPTIGGKALSQDHFLSSTVRIPWTIPMQVPAGTFPDGFIFLYGDPFESCDASISFAVNTGMIMSGCFNSSGTFSCYVLWEATINGTTLPTIVLPSTWGHLKELEINR